MGCRSSLAVASRFLFPRGRTPSKRVTPDAPTWPPRNSRLGRIAERFLGLMLGVADGGAFWVSFFACLL